MHFLKVMLEELGREHALDERTILEIASIAAECELVCVLCADTCLGERQPERLRAAIRQSLACADVCGATARIVSSPGEPSSEQLRIALEACARECDVCAETCGPLGQQHPHCGTCRDVCRRCEEACRTGLAQLAFHLHEVSAS